MRTGGIVDEDEARRACHRRRCGQGFETGPDGLLARGAAFDGRRELGAQNGVEFRDAGVIERGRVRGDHGLDHREVGMGRQCGEGPGEDRASADAAILLGNVTADADPAAGCDDHRGVPGGAGHGKVLPHQFKVA